MEYDVLVMLISSKGGCGYQILGHWRTQMLRHSKRDSQWNQTFCVEFPPNATQNYSAFNEHYSLANRFIAINVLLIANRGDLGNTLPGGIYDGRKLFRSNDTEVKR